MLISKVYRINGFDYCTILYLCKIIKIGDAKGYIKTKRNLNFNKIRHNNQPKAY